MTTWAELEEELIRTLVRKNKLREEEFFLRGQVVCRALETDEEKKRGSACNRPANFGWPVSFDGRPVSRDGLTTFHFNKTNVSKCATYGGDPRPYACVLTSGSSIGQETNIAGYDAYISDHEDARAADGAGYRQYIEEGPSRCEVIISNISDDPREREGFWRAVEESERTPSRDRLVIYPSRLSGDDRSHAIDILLTCPVLSDEDGGRWRR